MAFTMKDYFDLLRLLREHPEWKEELRKSSLSTRYWNSLRWSRSWPRRLGPLPRRRGGRRLL